MKPRMKNMKNMTVDIESANREYFLRAVANAGMNQEGRSCLTVYSRADDLEEAEHFGYSVFDIIGLIWDHGDIDSLEGPNGRMILIGEWLNYKFIACNKLNSIEVFKVNNRRIGHA